MHLALSFTAPDTGKVDLDLIANSARLGHSSDGWSLTLDMMGKQGERNEHLERFRTLPWVEYVRNPESAAVNPASPGVWSFSPHLGALTPSPIPVPADWFQFAYKQIDERGLKMFQAW